MTFEAALKGAVHVHRRTARSTLPFLTTVLTVSAAPAGTLIPSLGTSILGAVSRLLRLHEPLNRLATLLRRHLLQALEDLLATVRGQVLQPLLLRRGGNDTLLGLLRRGLLSFTGAAILAAPPILPSSLRVGLAHESQDQGRGSDPHNCPRHFQSSSRQHLRMKHAPRRPVSVKRTTSGWPPAPRPPPAPSGSSRPPSSPPAPWRAGHPTCYPRPGRGRPPNSPVPPPRRGAG